MCGVVGREPSHGYLYYGTTYRVLRLPMEILHEGLPGEYQAAP